MQRYSASSINCFRECKTSYIARYIKKKSLEQENTFGLFGTSLHEAIQYAYEQDDIPHNYYLKRLDHHLNKLNKSGGSRAIGYDRNKMIALGFKILDEFPFEKYSFDKHEVRFVIPFPCDLQVKQTPICELSGYIDAIDADKSLIVDFKSNTKKVRTTNGFIDKGTKEYTQLLIYVLAYQSLYGEVPNEVGIHHLRDHTFIPFDLGSVTEGVQNLTNTILEMNQLHQELEVEPELLECDTCHIFCPMHNTRKEVVLSH